VRAGLNVVKAKIERDGQFTSKAGKVRRRLGRPGAEAHKIEQARRELSKGTVLARRRGYAAWASGQFTS
jgi:hypothetical protein